MVAKARKKKKRMGIDKSLLNRPGTRGIDQAPVVQRLDNAIHRINHYPADSVVCFVNTYPLDSDFIRWIALSSLWTTGARNSWDRSGAPGRDKSSWDIPWLRSHGQYHKRVRLENKFYDPYSLTDCNRLFSVCYTGKRWNGLSICTRFVVIVNTDFGLFAIRN